MSDQIQTPLTVWQCEKHLGVRWPHDDCPGPGMPLAPDLEHAPWVEDEEEDRRRI